jgi:copper chaperone CopZ
MHERRTLSEVAVYAVPAIHCAHCVMSIREELSEVEGVDDVTVDLDTKVVTISGHALDDVTLRAAIAEAGYEAA